MIWVVTSAKMLLKLYREVLLFSIGAVYGLQECSYNKVNGVYSPNSYDLCTKVLRNEWGFEGVVMTDWFSTGGDKADTAWCMKVGNDLIMPGGGSYKAEILKGIRTGKIRETDLRRCCANVVKSILCSAIQKEYIG